MKYIYKITNSLAALALIPVLLFLPMFRFISVVGATSDNQLLSILGSMLDVNTIIEKVTGLNIENLPEFYTIRQAYEMFTGNETMAFLSDFDVSMLPEEAISYATAAGVFFVAALVFAALALVFGIFVKKKTVPAIFSVLGFGCTFGANKCFTYVAEQFVSGKISVVEILSKMEAMAEYQNYLKYLNFDIRILELDSAYTMMMVIFGAMILINVGFMLADSASA